MDPITRRRWQSFDYTDPAVVDKFLKDNPGRWNEGMNILVYSALLDACQAYRK